MTIIFYPNLEDSQEGSLSERIDLLMEGAERYKAIILDESLKVVVDPNKRLLPRDLTAAYNWEEIARALHSIRELPEGDRSEKRIKEELLIKIAEVYEVLRAAKMAKLEAVRLALVAEAAQLK